MKKCGKLSAKVLHLNDEYLQRMTYKDLYQTIGDLV